MKIYIITEGGSDIGFGHLTRMYAVYQGFKVRGITPKFIVNGDDFVEDIIKEAECEIFDWIDNKARLFDLIKGADIAIIDSYLADKSLYEEISNIVKLPVYYDDNNRLEYPRGVVINGNIHAKDLNYPERGDIVYLLGMEYLPLRMEFWDLPEKEIRVNMESIMITFGGDDVKNMTPKVLNFLVEEYPGLKKYVIIGRGFRNIDEIEKYVDNKTFLVYHPDGKKIRDIMLDSDIAISAGGQTLYELARVGVPTIAVIVAENQIGNVKKFEELGLVENVGWWNEPLSNIKSKILKLSSYKNRKEKSDLLRERISMISEELFSEKLLKKFNSLLNLDPLSNFRKI
ncbi:MAG: PseG/SpsG family protein [Calditerrivibrio sp.]|uniref:PseG/SpsG family protein n=1 Tax=Calditerrivibrio sp. TaxID=2792612 RepID=UPI003D11AF08